MMKPMKPKPSGRNRSKRKRKQKAALMLGAVLLMAGAAAIFLVTAHAKDGSDSVFHQGTVYSYSSGAERIVAYDAGNSYSVDKEGRVTIHYRNGTMKTEAPLTLDPTGSTAGMSEADTGFFISEDKTAIVYGFANGTFPLHVLISDDRGKTWNTYSLDKAMGYDTKFIGFTTRNDGWIVAGGSAGVGRALNRVYQTSDGGKSWTELGNPNELYSEHLTGAGFSNKDIGFLGFRYYMDNGPVVYWTENKGQSWEKLSLPLPAKYEAYKKTPLSPVFEGAKGRFPILLSKDGADDIRGTIYLISTDYGRTWTYEKDLDFHE
ncbi:WD40/YVTN/BNR-like repeat-containing protein [Gorillibacterium timonense]|uniref:WD40/YVTN/BNR-like repeat-containing protein n=1 Tax=Gorillibacterium timonense TaxID=1689269 RepID=UPI000D529148|nr:hypothetical protein [Gorillibacterium timonense]